jgi:hypothetical protein
MMELRKMKFFKLLLLLTAALIAACGGGSSGSTNVVSLNQGVTATANVQIPTGTSLALNATNIDVSASFHDLSGNPIPNLQVTFSTTMGSLNPAGGNATTNSAGLATVKLNAGVTVGAGLVSASAIVAGVKISQAVPFSVAMPPVTISTPVLGLSSLAPGGSTSVTVSLSDASGPFTTPVDVIFTSTFAQTGKASLISPVRTVGGVASSTYTATGGVGTDTITVLVGGSSISIPISIAGPAANSISFVSAAPQNISLKGMGGVGGTETSTVTFKVLDTSGQPKSGQTVDFTLNTTIGGMTITSSSASSGLDGTVSTIVKAGTFATPIRVTATIRGSSPLIATQSDQLVVSTGVPAQDSYSVSLSNLNSESFNHDGVKVGVTVRLSDHFHNPVPDGTAVYFTTTGGSIGASCLTAAGACSVQWTSQEPRPADGRIVILTYAVGEEAFVDSNGSGYADAGEFTPDTVAFRDDNFSCSPPVTGTVKDCVNNQQLPWLDFNSNTWAVGAAHSFPDPDPRYIGVLQGVDALGVPYAPTTPHLKHIFKNVQFVMSTDAAKIAFKANTVIVNPATPGDIEIFPTTTDVTIIKPGRFSVTVTDRNGNTMASGTTIAVTAPYGTLTGDTNVTVSQNTSAGQLLTLSLAAAPTPVLQQDSFIVVKVTSPSGLVSTGYIPISGSY